MVCSYSRLVLHLLLQIPNLFYLHMFRLAVARQIFWLWMFLYLHPWIWSSEHIFSLLVQIRLLVLVLLYLVGLLLLFFLLTSCFVFILAWLSGYGRELEDRIVTLYPHTYPEITSDSAKNCQYSRHFRKKLAYLWKVVSGCPDLDLIKYWLE